MWIIFNIYIYPLGIRKKFIGIERSTFLIDEKGILRNEWRIVKVKEHVQDVLQKLKKLKAPKTLTTFLSERERHLKIML